MSHLIECKSGIGRVTGEISGKVMVEMLDNNYLPIIKNGKPLNLLVTKTKLRVIGFIDGDKDDIKKEYLTLEQDPTIDIPEDIEFNINNPADEIDNGNSD